MHSNTYRAMRGIEVTEDNLAFETICDTVLGAGHFLGSQHTYAAMERDYFYPLLADRDEPRTWAEKGAQDAWSRARFNAQEILRNHQPNYLTEAQDRVIRKLFNII